MCPSDTPPAPTPGHRRWLWLLALCPLLIWGCWRAPFLSFDDSTYLRDNDLLQPGVSWLECWRLHPGEYFYYPLTLLSWRLDRLIWQPLLSSFTPDAWATGIRITNLLLHAAATCFVWLILRRLKTGPILTGFVTAAFALHPTACESVCWAIERKNVLSAALALCAVWLYINAQERRAPSPAIPGRGRPGLLHTLALLCYSAALLSKPSALGVLPIIILWEILSPTSGTGRRGDGATGGNSQAHPSVASGLALSTQHSPLPSNPQSEPGQEPRAKSQEPLRFLFAALWLIPSVAIAVITLETQHGAVMPPPGGSIFTALLTDVVILWRYVENFLFPVNLSAYYGLAPVTSLADPRLWACGAGLALVVSGTILIAENSARRLVIFGWLWFVGALGTNLNLVGINDLMHDRFVYLSAPGFWLAIGLAIQGAVRRMPSLAALRPQVATAAVLLLAVAWSAASLQRSYLFADSLYLFDDAAKKEPTSAYARIFFAGALKNKGLTKDKPEANRLLDRCFDELTAGLAAPDFDRYRHKCAAYVDLAYIYYCRGQHEKAAFYAKAALGPFPRLTYSPADRSKAWQILGLIDFDRGTFVDAVSAIDSFDRAVTLAPSRTPLYINLAKAWLSFKKCSAGNTQYVQWADAEARKALSHVKPGSPEYAAAQELLKELGP
ncbi:MAG TPA: hypothetical protein VGP72_00250 [Planctomycetota bacterium]|jgi:tetratricopeptide (TPR) repeat protein